MSEEKIETDIDDWMGELSGEENPFDEEARLAMEGPSSTEGIVPDQPGEPDLAAPVAAAGPADQSEIDALLADSASSFPMDDGGDDEAGMDQADLDSLFAGGESSMDAASPEMDQDHINQLLGETETPTSLLNEDLIAQGIDQVFDNSMLAGNAQMTDEVQTEETLPLENPTDDPDFGAFYQANMDNLLGSAGEQPELSSGSPALEQSDLDQLLGTAAAPGTAAVTTPSQEEMDQLFAKGAGEEEELFPSEPAPRPEPIEEEAFGFAGNELDDGGTWESTAEPASAPVFMADIAEEPAEVIEEKLIAPTEKKLVMPPAWLLAAKGKKALWSSAGACLVLLLGLAGYFTLHSRDKAPVIATAPPVVVVEPAAVQPAEAPVAPVAQVTPAAPVEPANVAPQAKNMEIALPADVKEVSVELGGQDPDNDPLEFVITELPATGRLKGSMPHLTYMPTGDFTGEDRFVYRANDGKTWSIPAVVLISGPPASAAQAGSATEIKKPRRPMIAATDLTLKTKSTDALDIDWRAVWRKANPSVPFSKKVEVEIVDKNLQGTLTRLDARHHSYAPAPYTDGREWLRYRFKLAGHPSKVRQLDIQIQLGDPRPSLALCPLDQQGYMVGDTVVLDASPSRDARPDTLVFSWRQTAGVPVKLETIHQNGSAVSFMVPSSFYSVNYPNPVIRVTAKNQAGHMDIQDITIKVQPNRQAAMWNGLR